MGFNPLQIFASVSTALAPLITLIILLLWVIALLKRKSDKHTENYEPSVRSHKTSFKTRTVKQFTCSDTDWQEFENLMAKIFDKEGYEVEILGGDQPDGGIDLILSKNDVTTLVQCKHWKSQQVGVKVIRELLGVMTSRSAESGIVVTSGIFSKDAMDFANVNSINLIDGSEINHLIKKHMIPESIHKNLVNNQLELTVDTKNPSCPNCKSQMLKRIAKKGKNKGSYFWGCPNYPDCKGRRTL